MPRKRSRRSSRSAIPIGSGADARARSGVIQLTGSELLDALRSPFAAEQLGCPSGEPVVVRLGGGTRPGPLPDIDHLIDAMASLPCVVIGIGDLTHPLRALVDVHAPD